MNPIRSICTLLILGGIAACDPPTVPPKLAGDVYEFRLPTQPPLVLRWPSGTTIRVFAASNQAPRATLLAHAIDAGAQIWNVRAFYAEYRLARVDDIRNADVIVRWSDETPPVDTNFCPPVLTGAGVTTFCLDASGDRLHVFPLLAPNDAATSRVRMIVTMLGTESQPERVLRLVTHELGHVLGLTRHSLNALDLMFSGELSTAALSVRDAATVQILYHTQPDVVP